jgi:hypothetical protein
LRKAAAAQAVLNGVQKPEANTPPRREGSISLADWAAKTEFERETIEYSAIHAVETKHMLFVH